MKTLDVDLLNEMVLEKYISVQKHPNAELYIYNYTQRAQFDRVWNDATLQCRGLIMDADGNIVARPFGKFFNLGEQENQLIPNEPFEVFEKMDGSLGILYWVNGQPALATRGSFTSDQSARGTEILYNKYAHVFEVLDKTKTYLFEIIYPQNRIVIDYGGMEDLVLLAVVDTATGEEHPLEEIGFPVVKRYDGINDIHILHTLEEANREGFVVRFGNGLRYKVKFEEYLRIHRIVTQVSTINIWEYLKEGMPLDELLDRVPDEFYNWVKATTNELLSAYEAIETTARNEMKVLETRKETALYFQTCKYPNVMFSMLDGKNHAPVIWKMLRPEFAKPFSNFEE